MRETFKSIKQLNTRLYLVLIRVFTIISKYDEINSSRMFILLKKCFGHEIITSDDLSQHETGSLRD